MSALTCSCARNRDGSTTTIMCPVHADTDPCQTTSRVTGKRRKGTIRRGVCSACGWTANAVQYEQDVATVRAHIARLTVLVERGVYPRPVLESYVACARERADWTEVPA